MKHWRLIFVGSLILAACGGSSTSSESSMRTKNGAIARTLPPPDPKLVENYLVPVATGRFTLQGLPIVTTVNGCDVTFKNFTVYMCEPMGSGSFGYIEPGKTQPQETSLNEWGSTAPFQSFKVPGGGLGGGRGIFNLTSVSKKDFSFTTTLVMWTEPNSIVNSRPGVTTSTSTSVATTSTSTTRPPVPTTVQRRK